MRKILRPYFFISGCGLLAFAPVSFMLRALKNDIIALEYPINHFISQSIRHGELPYWFNTWGMGFPLQSNLSWGIYSTPQMIFSSVFNYHIHALHIEFMFYILLSGWGMFYLLQRWIVKDQKIAQLLAIAYMLSGFMVGSTQWMLYITVAAFIPLLICSLLSLLEVPSFKRALQFAVCYTLMFTSVYAAFNIISTYCIVVFLLLYFLKNRKETAIAFIRIRYLLLAAGLTLLLCGPCLYFTLELLQRIDRGGAIATGSSFFNSNYLHPAALSSMLLPFSSVKMAFANTEGTMLNSYAGLFVLVLLPAALWLTIKEKNRIAGGMFVAALLFLLVSFGAITPLRQALNILPGFSFFRNPAIFRFYFILSLILFIALLFRNRSFPDLFSGKQINTRLIRGTCWVLAAVCLIGLLFTIKSLKGFGVGSLKDQIKNISYQQTLLLSFAVQLLFLISLLFVTYTQKWKWAQLVLAADLVINTLLCTPYFSVSSYSLAEVNNILHIEKGFPIQLKKPSESNTLFIDGNGNTWQNVNVFVKEVSSRDSYYGPLELKESLIKAKDLFDKPLVFANNDSTAKAVIVLLQKPSHVRVRTNLQKPGPVTLQQNYYPGWKVYINGKKVGMLIAYSPLEKTEGRKTDPGITVMAPAGEVVIDFRYERKEAWISALLLHLIVIGFCLAKLAGWIKHVNRSSSPS